MNKNTVYNKEHMYMKDVKELAGLLIEYKYALKNQYDKSNNMDFKEEIKSKIYRINDYIRKNLEINNTL